MSFLTRLRVRRSLNGAMAEALLAGRGVPAGASAGQQAVARVLEIASAPGSAKELADEVAAAAAFVQVTSRIKPRKAARRTLAAAACAVALGGTAVYASVMASPHHKTAPLPFGVLSTRPAIPAVTRMQPPQHERRQVQSRHVRIHPAMAPGVAP